jgi:hypothetical protein
MNTTVRGPHLPEYEVDTLAWAAKCLTGNSLQGGAQVCAEVLTGESAILLRFPSGGERMLYLDAEPHPVGVPVSFTEAAEIRRELDEAVADAAEAWRLEASATRDLTSALDVIIAARALLERIAAEDAEEPAPAWLRAEAYTFLRANPAP